MFETFTKDKEFYQQDYLENPIMRKTLKFCSFFFAGSSLAFVILDLIWGKTMFHNSVEVTLSLQNHASHALQSFSWFWWGATMVIWQYWPFFCLYIYPNKALGLKTFCIFQFANWCKNFIKLFYLDDRPNLEYGEIEPLVCKCEFGKPSGTLYNTTLIFVSIAWDCLGRNSTKKMWLRCQPILFALFCTLCVVYSIMYLGVHSWNQMLMSIFFSYTTFFLFAKYESKFIEFWEVIITKRSSYWFRRYFWYSMLITILLTTAYVIPLIIQWNAIDYSKYLHEGSCPACGTQNFALETQTSQAGCLAFPILVLVLSLRSHHYDYSETYLKDICNLKGLLRLIIAAIGWAPAIFFMYPAFPSPLGRIQGSIVHYLVAIPLYFLVVPWLFCKLGLYVKGDIAEMSCQSLDSTENGYGLTRNLQDSDQIRK